MALKDEASWGVTELSGGAKKAGKERAIETAKSVHLKGSAAFCSCDGCHKNTRTRIIFSRSAPTKTQKVVHPWLVSRQSTMAK